jgi:hypothetical protein
LEKHERTLAVVMTNDPKVNQIKIYDAIRAPRRCRPTARAAPAATPVASGSSTASCSPRSTKVPTASPLRRDRDRLRFDSLVYTTSAPVGIDFGNDHMCVAGTTTVDSFPCVTDTWTVSMARPV